MKSGYRAMKRTKIKKEPKVTLSTKDLTKIKRDVTKEETDKACLVILAAACDEFGLTEKQLCELMERTDRYAAHIGNHLVQMEDIRKTIENHTGIKIMGW